MDLELTTLASIQQLMRKDKSFELNWLYSDRLVNHMSKIILQTYTTLLVPLNHPPPPPQQKPLFCVCEATYRLMTNHSTRNNTIALVHNGQDKKGKLTFIRKIGIEDNICKMLLQKNLHNKDDKND